MPSSVILRSNIFGVSAGITSDIPPFTTAETTAAGKLIDKLKFIADSYIAKTATTVDWLGVVANAGQNNGNNSLVNRDISEPADITTANVFSGWSTPAMPVLPAFPTLPSDLKVDYAALKTSLAADIVALQNSWMARFLPTTTDISNYDNLFKFVLNGSNDASMVLKLDTLENELKAALSATMATINAALTSGIINARTAITTGIAGLQPKVDSAINLVKDNTQNIAWARGRDQAAREGARLEAEAFSDWAARGFSMPGGPLAAIQQQARQATLDKASGIAAEKAIGVQQQYLALAKIDIDSYTKNIELSVNSEISQYKTYADAQLRFAAMETDQNRAKAKQAFDHLGLRMDFTRFGADFAQKYRLGSTEAMNNLINAYANLSRNETDYVARIADAQRANLAALIEYYRVSLAQADMGIKVSLANNEKDIRFSQIAAEFIGRAVGNHVQAAAAASDAYARVAGMAMGGLNGVASITSGE